MQTNSRRVVPRRSGMWASLRAALPPRSTVVFLSIGTAVLITAVLMMPPLLAGCTPVAYASYLVGGDKPIPAQYQLPARRTLILVDDPRRQFTNPALCSDVAAGVAYHLIENEAIASVQPIEELLVPQSDLDALAQRLGEDYIKTSITQIGRLLDAETVIHVQVETVSIVTAAGLLEPAATSRVRVIDAAENRQLFPVATVPGDVSTAAVTVQSELLPRGSESNSLGARAVAMRDIAARIGRDAARLFYEYKPVPAGRRFEQN